MRSMRIGASRRSWWSAAPGCRPPPTQAWIDARARDDFASFEPLLAETMVLARALADALGWSEHPYDALVNLYEPGETLASLRALFGELRPELKRILAAAQARPTPRDVLAGDFPPAEQMALSARLAAAIGYDFKRGRIDPTVHPFEISFTRDDVRITTRFKPNHIAQSIFGTLHEAGHGLYEQNVDPAFTRSIFATDLIGLYAVGGTSYGAHESQSRLFENHVGRSAAFWRHRYPDLIAAFPVFASVPLARVPCGHHAGVAWPHPHRRRRGNLRLPRHDAGGDRGRAAGWFAQGARPSRGLARTRARKSWPRGAE